MESSSQEVHENANAIIDYQTHHRLRETQVRNPVKTHNLTHIAFPRFPLQSRKNAEDLNERIMVWSIFVTMSIFIVGFGQVLALKSFFSEKKPSQMYGYQ